MSKGARSKTCGSMGSGWFATVKDHHRWRSSWRRRLGYGVPSRKTYVQKNSLLKNLVGKFCNSLKTGRSHHHNARGFVNVAKDVASSRTVIREQCV